VLLLCLLKRRWSNVAIGALIVAGIAASACARAVLWSTTHSWERVYFGSDTHADGLLSGAFVAVLMFSGTQPKSPVALRALNWAAHLMMAYLGVFVFLGWAADPYMSQGGYLAMNLGISTIVLCLVCRPWAPLRWVCEAPPLVWLGRISYGVYLWHAIWFWILHHFEIQMPGPIWVLPLGGTVAIAAASYYGVERPLLRLKRRFSRVSSLSP
jgi:peptidoglycan/LPS O-acetylase OafA/YrhL